MTMLLVLAGMALIAAVIMIIPLLRRPILSEDRAAQELAGYRAQLLELQEDVECGRVDASQAQDIRKEVRQKILYLARTQKEILSVWKASPRLALIMGAIVLIGSGMIYSRLGSPNSPDQPLASRIHKELIRRARTGDANAQIRLLNEKLAGEPGSFEDCWTLANL
jgi:cytochrome c-type biogenesis protein CcmH